MRTSSVVITCDSASRQAIEKLIAEYDELYCEPIGTTTTGNFEIVFDNKSVASADIAELRHSWSNALESQLADEVTA
jgi:hypothetical protein